MEEIVICQSEEVLFLIEMSIFFGYIISFKSIQIAKKWITVIYDWLEF